MTNSKTTLFATFGLFAVLAAGPFQGVRAEESNPKDVIAAEAQKAGDKAKEEVLELSKESTSTPATHDGMSDETVGESNQRHFYWSGQGAFEYSSLTTAVSGATPTIFTEGIGFIGTYRFTRRWMAGLSTDYVAINQTNDPGTNGTNFSGTRWNQVSPTVGAFFGRHLVLFDYEFLGNWSLTKAASNTGSVQYKSLTGYRVRYFYPLNWHHLNIGAQIESLTYTTLNNSITGDTTLGTNQALVQGGVLLSYAL